MKDFIFDVECYMNYFEVKLKCFTTGKIANIGMLNGEHFGSIQDKDTLEKFITRKQNRLIGFNSINYDNIMVSAFIGGKDNQKLKQISDSIISGGRRWVVIKKHNVNMIEYNHIDLMEPAPGVQISLKLYGGRLNTETMQDLPIEPDAIVTEEEAKQLSDYCDNDLNVTLELYKYIKKSIELRENLSLKYVVDLCSKSDAQMAESIFTVYLEKEGVEVAKRQSQVEGFYYRVPEWVKFKSPEFKAMLEVVKGVEFTLNEKGVIVLPKALSQAIDFDGAKYKFGIGGLHSQEKKQVVIPSEDEFFAEWDVASMYPAIIIEQELYPKHLGPEFLDVYSSVKDERLHAKRTGDDIKNAAYKILLNGSYGKFGSKYSFLYSPELLIQTTITGQLSLLMLIESMTLAGGKVKSANTDGVNVLIKKADLQKAYDAQFEWELLTSYELEVTKYKAVYSRDVNNYIAVKENGIKGKGAFAVGGLMKNPNNNVCIEAVIANLESGADIAQHVNGETDVTKFCTVRKVTGGAMFRGEEVGKVVRFYHSVDGANLSYKKNGNKVPKSDGCKPLMDLTTADLNDIDRAWYIEECKNILGDLGL